MSGLSRAVRPGIEKIAVSRHRQPCHRGEPALPIWAQLDLGIGLPRDADGDELRGGAVHRRYRARRHAASAAMSSGGRVKSLLRLERWRGTLHIAVYYGERDTDRTEAGPRRHSRGRLPGSEDARRAAGPARRRGARLRRRSLHHPARQRRLAGLRVHTRPARASSRARRQRSDPGRGVCASMTPQLYV